MLYFSGMDTTLVVCTPLGAVVWFPTAVEDLLVVWIPPRPFLVPGRGLHTTWSGGMLYISGIDTTLAFFLHNRLGVWGGASTAANCPVVRPSGLPRFSFVLRPDRHFGAVYAAPAAHVDGRSHAARRRLERRPGSTFSSLSLMLLHLFLILQLHQTW